MLHACAEVKRSYLGADLEVLVGQQDATGQVARQLQLIDTQAVQRKLPGESRGPLTGLLLSLASGCAAVKSILRLCRC